MLNKNWPAVAIGVAYLLIGTLYALYTPRWQVPDEPAHYNYVRALAQGEGWPVLQMGDYDQVYLGQLTAQHFPPELSVATLEYEDHQPPLYYVLAVPIFWLGHGALLPLRLFSVLLGAVGLVALMALVREVAPERPGLAWLAGGLAAFLPQHVAMLAGVNNDALTEALLFTWLWLMLRYLNAGSPLTGADRSGPAGPSPIVCGLLLGTLLLTKMTAYGALALAALAVGVRWRSERRSFGWAAREAALLFGPALLLGALWWGRDLVVYGWPDVMGLLRHNAVVVGQPRTADWLVQYGWRGTLQRFLETTFRSFWGQFGWMGVVLDQRLYWILGWLTTIMTWGGLRALGTALRRGLTPRERQALLFLGGLAVIVLAQYLYYNVTFVQHQGRYLFPALPALALAGAIGLNHLSERENARLLIIIMIFLTAILAMTQWLPTWFVLISGAAAFVLAGITLLPARFKPWAGVALIAGLAALDLYCLFGFIVPLLT